MACEWSSIFSRFTSRPGKIHRYTFAGWLGQKRSQASPGFRVANELPERTARNRSSGRYIPSMEAQDKSSQPQSFSLFLSPVKCPRNFSSRPMFSPRGSSLKRRKKKLSQLCTHGIRKRALFHSARTTRQHSLASSWRKDSLSSARFPWSASTTPSLIRMYAEFLAREDPINDRKSIDNLKSI